MTTDTTPEPRQERTPADIYAVLGIERPTDFPPSPEIAVLIGCTFQRLGGTLQIDSNGQRLRGRPCSGFYSGTDNLPQLPGAQPWERFHNPKEWEGAIKLVDYFLTRLARLDRDFIFDAFTSAVLPVAGGEA